MKRVRILFAWWIWGVLGLLLAGCGGGLQEEGESPQVRSAKPLATVPPPMDATTVMNWAEGAYANLFPGPQSNQIYGPYIYRFYPATGNYLGVDGGDIYVMGPLVAHLVGPNTPFFVGRFDDFYCQVYPTYCLSGTAATGAPMAGATVTVKDSTGDTATATTSISGDYVARTFGLTPPFLVQVTPLSGTVLYSVTANSQPTVANITPWTDLLVRSWYGVQGVMPETAFAAPVTYPPPDPTQVTVLGETLLSIAQLGINVHGADINAPADFITRPFAANGLGTDRLLDYTHVTLGPNGATLVLSVGSATQTTALSYNTVTSSVTATSTTTDGISTSTGSIVQLVPVQAAQAAALAEINARLAEMAATVNSRGVNLVAADLEPYFAADTLDSGLNRSQLLAGISEEFSQGQTLALSVRRILRLDAGAGEAELEIDFRQTLGSLSDSDAFPMRLRRTSGIWYATGDGRIAQVGIDAEARRNQGAYTGNNGPSINMDVRPVQGTVSAVSVASALGTVGLSQGSTQLHESGALLDTFAYNTGPLSGTLPAAGTPFTVTLTRSNASTVSYTLELNAFTTEQIQITSPTGIGLASANLGGTLNVQWTLPVTYAVKRVRLATFVFTGHPSQVETLQCEADAGVLGTTATSGSLQMPATCDGQPIAWVNIMVSVDGAGGESSQVIYTMN